MRPQLSQHQQEDQNIVPSIALNLARKDCHVFKIDSPMADSMHDLRNPLLQVPSPRSPYLDGSPADGGTLLETGVQVSDEAAKIPVENIKPKKKDKEKKRPRDIILRDPQMGTQALEIRRLGAFLGYEYRQPVMVQEIVEQVLANDLATMRSKDHRHGGDPDDRDLGFEKRVFVEAGGQLSPSRKPVLL